MEQELHYFTFGIGQVLEGHVQPILAISESQARETMNKTYGNKWAFHYDEKQWQRNKEQGFGNERVLDLIKAY